MFSGSWADLARRTFIGIAVVFTLFSALLSVERLLRGDQEKVETLTSQKEKMVFLASRFRHVEHDVILLNKTYAEADAGITNRLFKKALHQMVAAGRLNRMSPQSRQALNEYLKRHPNAEAFFQLAYRTRAVRADLEDIRQNILLLPEKSKQLQAAEAVLANAQNLALVLDLMLGAALIVVLLLARMGYRRRKQDSEAGLKILAGSWADLARRAFLALAAGFFLAFGLAYAGAFFPIIPGHAYSGVGLLIVVIFHAFFGGTALLAGWAALILSGKGLRRYVQELEGGAGDLIRGSAIAALGFSALFGVQAMLDNNCACLPDPSATDWWFYAKFLGTAGVLGLLAPTLIAFTSKKRASLRAGNFWRLFWTLLPSLAATCIAALPAFDSLFGGEPRPSMFEGCVVLFAVGGLVWAALRLPERARDIFESVDPPLIFLLKRNLGRLSFELPFFNDFLRSALKQGLPLPESLFVYAEQVRNPRLKHALVSVGADVERGQPFSQALGAFPKVFPRSYVSLVKAGEAMGDIPQALSLSAASLGRDFELKDRIKAASLYPAVVGASIVAVTAFLVTFVIPTFKNIFSSYGAALPLITRILIGASTALTAPPVILILLGGGMFAARQIHRNPALVPALLIRLPFIGALALKEREARLCRLLANMLQSGCSMSDALESCAEDMVDASTRRGLEAARQRVGRGEKLSTALSAAGAFSRELVWACSLGEERENLPDSLVWLAEYDELCVHTRLEYLAPIMERSANIAIGLLVGFIVIALFSPMFGFGELALEHE